jgi:hypothetical protein
MSPCAHGRPQQEQDVYALYLQKITYNYVFPLQQPSAMFLTKKIHDLVGSSNEK